MKIFYSSHLAIVSLLLLSLATAPNLHTQTLSAEKIYKQVSDAVVVILSYDSNDELSKQGSGVVINDKGYVVTNYHVLAGNDRLEVFHNKELIPYVDIIGIDVEKDILILKIEAKKFPAIKIGDSEKLSIGQRVYAIGSPLGYENTISEGIISGLRSYEESERNFIQITASISPGSSGGAVVNDKGELIGISTLTDKEGQNLNFAIPINDVLAVKNIDYTENDKTNEFAWYYRGMLAYQMEMYQDAIRYFTIDINMHPSEAKGYLQRGNAKKNTNDYTGAIQDYDKAIELYPNDEVAFFSRGFVKQGLEDFSGALQDYTKAIEINPNSFLAYNNRGLAKYNLEDFRGSIQDFNKAIEINPNNADAYVNRGASKSSLEYYEESILDYTKAIELNPFFALAYNNRGQSKIDLKDFEGAIDDFNKALEINPVDAIAYNNLGITKPALGDYLGALQDLNKAININPNYAQAYRNRGLVKSLLGDTAGCCLDLSKAGELGYYEAYDLIKEYCK